MLEACLRHDVSCIRIKNTKRSRPLRPRPLSIVSQSTPVAKPQGGYGFFQHPTCAVNRQKVYTQFPEHDLFGGLGHACSGSNA